MSTGHTESQSEDGNWGLGCLQMACAVSVNVGREGFKCSQQPQMVIMRGGGC